MNTLIEKAAYLKGLADGMEFNSSQGKKFALALADIVEDMAKVVGYMQVKMDSMELSIADLEEDFCDLYDDEYDEDDEDDEPDCEVTAIRIDPHEIAGMMRFFEDVFKSALSDQGEDGKDGADEDCELSHLFKMHENMHEAEKDEEPHEE